MKHPGDRHQAGAVQRGVDQFQSGGFADAGTDGAGFDGAVQRLLAVLAHVFDQTLGNAVLKGHHLRAGENVGFLDFRVHHGGGIVRHLAAVGAVGLEAVVLGGVVGGGDHDAGVRLVVPGGEGQGGDGHQRVVNPHPDAVRGQNAGGVPGEHVGIDAAVVGNGDQPAAALGLDPVRQTLGGLPDDVNIHPVAARAQNAPQTRGAEFQRHGKALLDFTLLAFDLFQFVGKSGVFQLSAQPALIIINVHCYHLFSFFHAYTIVHPAEKVNVSACGECPNML